MIDGNWPTQFAQEWIAAWNARDIDRILSHYTDDFEMRSPLIVERMGITSGVLKGKDAVRPYWERGLAASPPLHFQLHDVLVGTNSIALYYRNVTRDRMVVEVMTLNDRHEIVSASALYGEPGRSRVGGGLFLDSGTQNNHFG